MLSVETFRDDLRKYKIIAIVRNIEIDKIPRVVASLYSGGIRFIEFTFDNSKETTWDDLCRIIREVSLDWSRKIWIGAGSVVTVNQVDMAVSAGAKYIISPHFDKKIVIRTKQLNAISIPGGMSSSEIILSYRAGADYVKLFPAGHFGVSYIKMIRSPLDFIPLLAVGGVNDENILDFLETGIEGVGVGAALVSPELINRNDFDSLVNLAKVYTQQIDTLNTKRRES